MYNPFPTTSPGDAAPEPPASVLADGLTVTYGRLREDIVSLYGGSITGTSTLMRLADAGAELAALVARVADRTEPSSDGAPPVTPTERIRLEEPSVNTPRTPDELLADVAGTQVGVGLGNGVSLDWEHAQAVIDAIVELRALRDERTALAAPAPAMPDSTLMLLRNRLAAAMDRGDIIHGPSLAEVVDRACYVLERDTDAHRVTALQDIREALDSAGYDIRRKPLTQLVHELIAAAGNENTDRQPNLFACQLTEGYRELDRVAEHLGIAFDDEWAIGQRISSVLDALINYEVVENKRIVAEQLENILRIRSELGVALGLGPASTGSADLWDLVKQATAAIRERGDLVERLKHEPGPDTDPVEPLKDCTSVVCRDLAKSPTDVVIQKLHEAYHTAWNQNAHLQTRIRKAMRRLTSN